MTPPGAPALAPLAVGLDALAADPSKVEGLPRSALVALYTNVARLEAMLRARLLTLGDGRHAKASDDDVSVLTPEELAKRWRMPEARIRDLCRSGALPARKLGPKEWIISVSALRDWLPKAGVANDISPGLSLRHDPGRGSQAAEAARPYTVAVRRPGRRPQGHRGGVGGGDEGHERHDGPAAPHHREAGGGGARTAPQASGDDSPSKGALT